MTVVHEANENETNYQLSVRAQYFIRWSTPGVFWPDDPLKIRKLFTLGSNTQGVSGDQNDFKEKRLC
jgi:hypothetical protein